MAAAQPLVDTVQVALSSATASAFAISPADATAQYKVDNDGNVYRRINNQSWTQINTLTNWVRPTSFAPGLYEVRYTNITGNTGDFSASAAVNVWFSLSSGDFICTLLDTTNGFSSRSVSFTIEIRNNGGPVLASAAIFLNTDIEL